MGAKKKKQKTNQAASDESQQHAFKNRAAALREVPSEWVPGQGAAEALFKQKVNKWLGELQFILFPYVLPR